MAPDDSRNDLYALRDVIRQRIDWDALLERAIAEGRGVSLDVDTERAAGVDELLAAALREMFALGELSALASFDPLADECRNPLARLSASLVRLLDRALKIHAYATGYDVAEWRKSATLMANVAACDIENVNPEENPLPDTLRRTAGALADAVSALPRDRMDVPDQLAHAISDLLLIYAAAREIKGGTSN